MAPLRLTARKKVKTKSVQPRTLCFPLDPEDSIPMWVELVREKCKRLGERGYVDMRKPEFQALMLLGNLPPTQAWNHFRERFPLRNKLGVWNPAFYFEDRWTLTLDVLQAILCIESSFVEGNYVFNRPQDLEAPVASIGSTAGTLVDPRVLEIGDASSHASAPNLVINLESDEESGGSSTRSTLASHKRRRC